MDPVLKAVLLSWDWRLDVLLVLALAGTLYTAGWWRLRQRIKHSRQQRQSNLRQLSGSHQPLVVRWRLVTYLVGLLVLGLALMSPIDVLGSQLFLMHMIQHLMLIMIAPPLLLLANPMPFVLWGLPTRLRLRVGRFISRLLHRKGTFRQGLRSATTPGVVWLIWIIAIIGWHDPHAYNAALRSDLIHDVEHLFFFGAGMLFWWHVTGAGPRIHKQFGLVGRIAFVLSAVPPNMLVGVALAFVSEPIYTYYTAVPRLWNISVMTDQQLGGVIMWVPGSMMYITAALILVAQLLQGESSKPSLPESEWGTEEALLAPGLEKQS